MILDRIFFGYMALAGIALGTLLVVAPHVQDFWIKPYFWILIAVAVFDGGSYLYGRNAPGTMIGMPARLLGFVIGILLMVSIPTLAGAPVRFF